MPKPRLNEKYGSLESELVATMTAGLHEWRRDLNYPESHSDWSACIRALFRMYKIERRPIAISMASMIHPDERCDSPICTACGNADEPDGSRKVEGT